MSPRKISRRLALLLLPGCLLLLVGVACGGDDAIVIDLPTPAPTVPLTEEQIRRTLVKTMTPPTPTPDLPATRAASVKATQTSWPQLESRGDRPADGYYLNPKDVEYLTIFGPSVWHSSRVDLLVSGLHIGYISSNEHLREFFGSYELVDRPEQWKCHERLRQAVHREMLNLRTALGRLAEYEVEDVSDHVHRYANDLRAAIHAADASGNAFLRIQAEVCTPGYVYDPSGDGADDRRELHDRIATNTAIFHRLMSQYGCAICGELYRR